MRKESPPRDSSGFVDVVVRPGGSGPRGGVSQRPRPRRRRSRRGTTWRRVLLPLLLWAAIIAGGVAVICRASRPFMLYDREKHATSLLRQQLDECRKENDLLARRIKYLETPEGRAQAARELGWVKPGEITLVIPPENQPKPKQ